MILKCRACAGLGFKWKVLGSPPPVEADIPPEPTTVRCWDCKGTGYVDERGNPVHFKVTRL